MYCVWTLTHLSRRFRLALPIVQGPFGGGMSTAKLTAAVSNAGCLGCFGANALEPEQIATLVRELRGTTGAKPFAINLWVDDPAATRPGAKDFAEAARLLEPLFRDLGLQPPVALPVQPPPDYRAQVEAALRAGTPVLSFVFGTPCADVMTRCRHHGVRTIGTATTVEEALSLEAAGVDAVVATGFEAGGHRPSYLRAAEACLTGTLALVPQVVDAVKVPVIAAGGIADGRGIAAALALGAQGVQIGTAFLACDESGAPAVHRDALFAAQAIDTVLTRVISGRLVRAINNQLISALQAQAARLLSYPAQNRLTAPLRQAAAAQGRAELLSLQSGQVGPLLRERRADELIDALVRQTATVLDRLKRSTAAGQR